MIIGLLLLTYGSSHGQHTIMRSFNINDGLVSNQVRGFYQDKKGFIWIYTWEGLSRHDGHTFRNYTLTEGLAHPLINAIIEGRDDKMYIAENDGTVDVIINGEVHPEFRKNHATAINKFIKEPSGRILAPSDARGISIFNEGSIENFNKTGTSVSVSDVVIDANYFLICGYRSGVINFDHTLLKWWPDTITDYNCIIKDDLDRIWVGTSSGLRWVNRISGNADRYDLIMTAFAKHEWSGWIIRDILQSKDGTIWIAAKGGLIQILQDQSFRVYNRYDGLPSEYITAIFEDQKGYLWIGTDQGIARMDIRNTIDIFTISQELNTNASDVQPTLDGGAFVISNNSTVFRVQLNKELQSVDLDKNLNAYTFLIMGGDTLVSTHPGYYKITRNQSQPWNEIPFVLRSLAVELDGCIFSTNFGTISMACQDERYTDTITSDVISSLARRSDKEVWVGTQNAGIYQILINRSVQGKIEFKWNEFSEYLPEKTIRSLHIDERGNIWIGTRYSGLIQLIQDSLSGSYSTRTFDRRSGFNSDFIKSIVSDKDGVVWVGTHAGIEKLIPVIDGYRVFSFSRVHNFFATIIDLAVGLENTIWCTSTSGVVRIKDQKYENTLPSGVYITSVSTAQANLVDPQEQLPFDLSYNENFLDIGFSSNDHVNAQQVKYSYRLKGSQDTSWSKPLTVHNVSFANLLPGDYSFEVRVLGWNGQMGKETAYRFKIRPPFWQQTWFLLLSLAALLAVLFSFYRYRIRQLNQIQEVRNRIASDLHDEIGSSLTHVNILSEIGKKTSEPSDQSQKIFKRIGEEVQTSSEALDDIIWSVSTRTDTAEDLISRMRRYASELFDAKGISFSLHEDDLDETQSIGLELRRDFYLIYKELLRNVLRHANATEVDISIKGENRFLWLMISDNGQGFNPEALTDRQGLHSIRGRVAKWKGHISIDSSPDKGTSTRIGLPLKSGHFLKIN